MTLSDGPTIAPMADGFHSAHPVVARAAGAACPLNRRTRPICPSSRDDLVLLQPRHPEDDVVMTKIGNVEINAIDVRIDPQ